MIANIILPMPSFKKTNPGLDNRIKKGEKNASPFPIQT
jgi:hypothetical protein